MRDVTLCFLRRKNEVLLGMKKRGFATGRYNGYGGKVDKDESIEEAAVREIEEESTVKVKLKDLKKVGAIEFTFPTKPEWTQRVHLFIISQWEGEPTETEEMQPEWRTLSNIPYADMWPDDPYWLPHIFLGKYVEGSFSFGEDQETILDYKLSIQ